MSDIINSNCLENTVYNHIMIKNYSHSIFEEKLELETISLIEANPNIFLKIPQEAFRNTTKYLSEINDDDVILFLKHESDDFIYLDFVAFGKKQSISLIDNNKHNLIINRELLDISLKNPFEDLNSINIDKFIEIIKVQKPYSVQYYEINNNFNPKNIKYIKEKNIIFSTILNRRIDIKLIKFEDNHIFSFSSKS